MFCRFVGNSTNEFVATSSCTEKFQCREVVELNISRICESKYFADPLLESLYGHILCLVSVVVPSSSCGWDPYDKQDRFQTMGQNHTLFSFE